MEKQQVIVIYTKSIRHPMHTFQLILGIHWQFTILHTYNISLSKFWEHKVSASNTKGRSCTYTTNNKLTST